MQLDLRQAVQKIRHHIVQRAQDYSKRRNQGPGKHGAPVTQITIGYQFDQSGWAALVFDTRPKAGFDGEWNAFITPKNMVKLPEWKKACSVLGRRGARLELIKHNGRSKTLGADTSEEDFAEHLGVALRHALEDAQEQGAFAGIPLAKDCALSVEEHSGQYGWSSKKTDEEAEKVAHHKRLDGKVAAKSRDGQIAHWIAILEKTATGRKKEESTWSFQDEDYALEKLERFGASGVVAVLKFLRKWSEKAETTAVWDATWRIYEFLEVPPARTPEMEALLCEIVARSVKANARRKEWTWVSVNTAQCLRELFDGYPELETDHRLLLNHEAFTTPASRRAVNATKKKR